MAWSAVSCVHGASPDPVGVLSLLSGLAVRLWVRAGRRRVGMRVRLGRYLDYEPEDALALVCDFAQGLLGVPRLARQLREWTVA